MDEQERLRREKIVAENCGGIHPPYEAFYLEALVYAAGRAVAAFDRYDAATKDNSDEAAIVANVHEALTHAAAVSRFFWPPRTKGSIPPARAAKLRQAFNVDESSPLHERDLRNTLEHFDERLDEFLLQDVAGCVFPGPMVGSADLADEELGHIFRLVDPTAETFVLLGKKYPFGPLRNAVSRLYREAFYRAGHGGRL